MDVVSSPFPSVDIPDVDLWSFSSNDLIGHIRLIKKGDVLVVFTDNSIDVPPIVWGTLAIGGVVCPVNPNYRAEELLHPLQDTKARALVTQRARAPVAFEAAKRANIPRDRVLLLDKLTEDDFHDGRMNGPHSAPIDRPAEDLAFLVYSSGTTGLPKAVMLSHRNMIANLLQTASVDNGVLAWNGGLHGEGDSTLALLPFFHIYGITYLLNHTVYLVPPIILELVSNPRITEYDLSSLRMMLSAAAPLAVELIQTLHQKLKLNVRQAYGMSECAPCTHMQTWNETHTHLGSVGRLLPNMTAKYAPVEGETGRSKELWVKGPNVFLGYLNNPKVNGESFSEDGYYKTGDVGHEDENGHFYITDRVKELIKYNGFQVAPAELEAIALGHPAITDVAVTGIKVGQSGTELPRAYVVVAPGYEANQSTADAISQYVSDQVINYKRLRGGVRFVQAIPRNPSGKILRRELKKLDRVAKL
ncbi:putative luciferase [Aspergillus flavus AF70]|nr:putative luciferase [Aspergillus flavus AF70]